MFFVRVWFDWQEEEVFDEIGPWEHYFAMLVCIDYAETPYWFGITPVRVKRALIVPAPWWRES